VRLILNFFTMTIRDKRTLITKINVVINVFKEAHWTTGKKKDAAKEWDTKMNEDHYLELVAFRKTIEKQ